MNYNQARHLIRYHIVRYTNGKGIEFSDVPPMYPHFLGLRWEDGLSIIAEGSLDFVVAVMPKEINIAEWWKRLKYGGFLVLADTVDLSGVANEIMIGCEWLVNRKIQDLFFRVYRKTEEYGAKHLWMENDKRPKAAVVRYGGYGDIIQCAGVFKELHNQGYYVVCITDSKAYRAVKNDPYINDFVVHGRGQMDGELGQYWATISEDYDLWINLVESTEGALLCFHDRIPNTWPHEVRHSLYNKNYTELIHKISEVPFNTDQAFYYTSEEESEAVDFSMSGWVRDFLEGINDGKVILWVIHNQAVHKIWPYVDEAINRIVEETDYRVVLVGDKLKHDFAGVDRVISKAGIWSIRQSMTFACTSADIVIGPETGVLNACAMEEVKKIVFMSHSSVENLTKHWVNTVSLMPDGLECYPCHRLHSGFGFCNQDKKTGLARCQAMIGVDDVLNAIK